VTCEQQKQNKGRMQSELQGLGVVIPESIPKEVQRLHTSLNPMLGEGVDMLELIQESQIEVNLAITSDPGEPLSLKAATSGPEKEKWIEAIKKETNNFLSRGVWKKVSRKEVVNIQKRKLIITKWILKKKLEQDQTIQYKTRCV
jgi:hypothetical protein